MAILTITLTITPYLVQRKIMEVNYLAKKKKFTNTLRKVVNVK